MRKMMWIPLSLSTTPLISPTASANDASSKLFCICEKCTDDKGETCTAIVWTALATYLPPRECAQVAPLLRARAVAFARRNVHERALHVLRCPFSRNLGTDYLNLTDRFGLALRNHGLAPRRGTAATRVLLQDVQTAHFGRAGHGFTFFCDPETVCDRDIYSKFVTSRARIVDTSLNLLQIFVQFAR